MERSRREACMKPDSPSSSARRFEESLQPILEKAYGTALRLVRSPEDAEDLVQDAALLAFRAFDSFQEGTNFNAWFFKILMNRFFQHYRKRRREPDLVHLEDTPDPDFYLYEQTRKAGWHKRGVDPVAFLFAKIDRESISNALDALPEEYCIVASLYFMGEFAYEEIAQMLDCPVGTVRSRLHRGRKTLQQALWQVAVDRGVVAEERKKK
jgi:RNA polymerase sigma-70 factor (ECF subfamily)